MMEEILLTLVGMGDAWTFVQYKVPLLFVSTLLLPLSLLRQLLPALFIHYVHVAL